MSYALQVVVEDVTEEVAVASVRSEASDSKWYRVILTRIANSCTCPDHSNRVRDCKHIRTAVFQLQGVLTAARQSRRTPKARIIAGGYGSPDDKVVFDAFAAGYTLGRDQEAARH